MMSLEAAFAAIHYRGDSVVPSEGQHDLRLLAAETVRRLPRDVRDWFLHETWHVFIGGHGQTGEFIDLFISPDAPQVERLDGKLRLRMIYLSERLMTAPRDDVLWAIAHEIAHSRLNLHITGQDDEVAADRLVREWGFTESAERAARREKHFRAAGKPASGARPHSPIPKAE
jgi:hypothetical protein